MFYDPQYRDTKTDPMTLKGFIAWLETQRPDTYYTYGCSKGCAIAQYVHANGYPNALIGKHWWLPKGGRFDPPEKLPRDMDWVASTGIQTFGSALKRAKGLLLEGTWSSS